jgi:pimeloyl-ACP methyl ester carboxylesterase
MLPIYFSDMAYLAPTFGNNTDSSNRRQRWLISRIILIFSLFTLLLTPLAEAVSAPKNQELAWEQALIKSSDPNEIKWLRTPNEKFIALHSDDFTGTLRGGVILLHGMGGHPDWPDVISPLRKSLPKHGWSTLSIQLPTFEKGGQISDYNDTMATVSARIKAAIEHFLSIGNSNIVLLGHGLGSTMGASFLASTPDNGVAAFIGISMPYYRDGEEWMDLTKSIEKINLPMLDVYGSNDLTSVINNADKRALAARRGGLKASKNRQFDGFNRSATAKGAFSKIGGFIAYRKFQITGANHSFRGQERILSKRIIGWLKHHASGVSVGK